MEMRAAMNAAALALMAMASSGVGAAERDDDALRLLQITRGREVLRAMDCARCHGRDYRGWAAPSLVAAVRDAPRERFDRIVLEGDIARGMPPYKSQPMVVAALDAMYAYLIAQAGVDRQPQATAPSSRP
jgi:mono/diheme cytochrome c family protein